jgi:hypothetical protein
MRKVCGGHACSRATLFCELNTTKGCIVPPRVLLHTARLYTLAAPYCDGKNVMSSPPQCPSLPIHTIPGQKSAVRRVQAVRCVLLCMRYTQCTAAPSHPCTRHKTYSTFAQARRPPSSHDAEPVRDGGGRATPHHDAYALVLVWYGTGYPGL